MIKTEFYEERKDGVRLYKRYSNKNVYIKQQDTGDLYVIAIDVQNTSHKYIETKQKIPEDSELNQDYIDENITINQETQ